ncbi:hypothetical protein [Bradyrhizobium sp. AS23.2]|uniref:hypothetical protein n=1 Tax=Bradyrhizobium sp. AS23.2 TaxID=1680155 RepID=UPI000939384A|nr:hypothetical protein [Bradyrhizobium sp. AS23.2]OKO71889.1 hypothetical protein AC630_31740 [Bradyrhizobium sp. AS23.2]
MLKYTPEQVAESVARSREAIARVNAGLTAPRPGAENPEAVEIAAPFEPRESRNERHRRELSERDEQWAAERRRERASLERRIASLEAQVAGLYEETIGLARATNTYTDALEHELAHRSAEVAELKLAQARLEKTIAELELKLVTTGRTIDLPSLRAVQ